MTKFNPLTTRPAVLVSRTYFELHWFSVHFNRRSSWKI